MLLNAKLDELIAMVKLSVADEEGPATDVKMPVDKELCEEVVWFDTGICEM